MWKELVLLLTFVCLANSGAIGIPTEEAPEETVEDNKVDAMTAEIKGKLQDMHRDSVQMKHVFFILTKDVLKAIYEDTNPDWTKIIGDVLGYIVGTGDYLVKKFEKFLGPWAPDHMTKGQHPDPVSHFDKYPYTGHCHEVVDFVKDGGKLADKWLFAMLTDVFCLGHFESELFEADLTKGMSLHDYEEFMGRLTEQTMDLYWDGALLYHYSMKYLVKLSEEPQEKDQLVQRLRNLLADLKK